MMKLPALAAAALLGVLGESDRERGLDYLNGNSIGHVRTLTPPGNGWTRSGPRSGSRRNEPTPTDWRTVTPRSPWKRYSRDRSSGPRRVEVA